ncbi:Uncharacterised protein [Mycobacterium tuberculosis]|uniref:Uncharacterized protein n=1 Tax=Mycobacterium tuberculosis TaxID=1773 RepID=A0A916PGU2_MYCTX|nr:Uncharacterised protein [Mycobacterium tuberculosis]
MQSSIAWSRLSDKCMMLNTRQSARSGSPRPALAACSRTTPHAVSSAA